MRDLVLMWIWFSWESRHDDERRSLGNTLSDSSAQSVSVATVKTDLNCSFVHIKSYMDIILVTQYHLYFIVVYYAFIMSRLQDCKSSRSADDEQVVSRVS